MLSYQQPAKHLSEVKKAGGFYYVLMICTPITTVNKFHLPKAIQYYFNIHNTYQRNEHNELVAKYEHALSLEKSVIFRSRWRTGVAIPSRVVLY